jgi:hypothetical protein
LVGHFDVLWPNVIVFMGLRQKGRRGVREAFGGMNGKNCGVLASRQASIIDPLFVSENHCPPEKRNNLQTQGTGNRD